MHKDLFAAYTSLQEAVRCVIIRKGVIDLYLDGQHKSTAVASAEAAQENLSRKLTEYSNARILYNKYLTDHKRALITTRHFREYNTTCFEVVEQMYAQVFNIGSIKVV